MTARSKLCVSQITPTIPPAHRLSKGHTRSRHANERAFTILCSNQALECIPSITASCSVARFNKYGISGGSVRRANSVSITAATTRPLLDAGLNVRFITRDCSSRDNVCEDYNCKTKTLVSNRGFDSDEIFSITNPIGEGAK
jgi:hypothetical protein